MYNFLCEAPKYELAFHDTNTHSIKDFHTNPFPEHSLYSTLPILLQKLYVFSLLLKIISFYSNIPVIFVDIM